ncbi:DEAD-box ATP-dependent RNA helicase 7-like [Iris pallida]|uniref:RNA helicase n=1 Tax=Iris pallida TaxID=29817 RepID=A0AAX6DMH9_IRIPA|nr:DEAD-box ATP-dependent RNA helicase 7-like [Iris pallida]
MPSLAAVTATISPEPAMDSIKKHKKSKNPDPMELEPTESPVESKKSSKKEKKSKKSIEPVEPEKEEEKKKSSKKSKKSIEPEEPEKEEKKSSSKKKKKRKASSSDEDGEEGSEKSDISTDPAVVENESSLKKQKLMEVMEVVEKEVEDPNAVSKFRISEALKAKLKAKGIHSLFPIQAMTFNLVMDGSDLVGRARTGQGKTLAFVLPILEALTSGHLKSSTKTGYGRTPCVLVLLPTRELAKQVHVDFEAYGQAVGLSACCVYGGASMRDQGNAVKRGVDIIVGTPGRVKDLIERNSLDLKALKFRVLDEADEMLNMGFVDDVEFILGKVADVTKVQTLLFSATLPDWVKKISARFLKPDKKTVDLVGNEKLKASASIRHLVMPCSSAARSQLIPDIIRCYSSGGRTIIFTETRESASQLSGLLPGARALHGDIMQAQREVILAGFRSGKFLVLVATNVAARGLDINDVQLIIQCEPPRDVEAYIHRSGRTGRAGNTGVAVLLYEPRYSHSVFRIERESGVKFEHISAPQAADVAASAGSEAAEAICKVSDSVVPVFRQQAEELLNSSGLPALDLLAKALAKAAGYTDIKKRSILSSMDNHVTLLLQAGKTIYSPTFAFSILRRFLPEEKIEAVKGLSLTADGSGVVFDVPADEVNLFLEGKETSITIEVLKKLPPLQEKEQSRGGRGRFGGGGGGNRFSGGRGGGFSKGRGFGRRN